MSESEFSYDAVRYPGGAFPFTHPAHLRVMAGLFSVDTCHPTQCRYLELGCGDGANLWPMAEQLPEAQFVGVDLSARAIEDGQRVVEAIGLRNVTLVQADLLAWEPEGHFDYIVAHGLYAWVPPVVQNRVLELAAKHLSPNGVAYVSYNTKPGSLLRQINRDLGHFHAAALADPRERARQGRAIAEFVARSVPDTQSGYKALLEGQTERLGKVALEVLVHDDFGEVYDPPYFYEFMTRAQSHGLQYLAEAEFDDMQYPNVAPEVKAQFRQTDDIVRYEQYLDFLTCRSFRKTLLMRADVAITRTVNAEYLKSLSFRSLLVPESQAPDVASDAVERFRAPTGLVLAVSNPITKAALTLLHKVLARPLPFAELHAEARRLSGSTAPSDAEAAGLAEQLLELYGGGAVLATGHHASIATHIGERPKTWATARYQVRKTPGATNGMHENIRLDAPLTRAILMILDGTQDRAGLLAMLVPAMEAGHLPPPDGEGPLLPRVEAALDEALRRFCDNGLLMGD